jgi:hypothetical protein
MTHREYVAYYRQNIHLYQCDCGNQAAYYEHSSFICQRCHDLEAKQSLRDAYAQRKATALPDPAPDHGRG